METPKPGSYAYSITNDAYGNIRSDQFPVTAGVQYDATAWIRGEVDTDDSRDTGVVWIVRVRWEDLNGTYLGYSNAEVGTAAGGLPSSFAEKGGTVTAPAGAVYGRVEVYFYLASGWLNVDDVSVTPTTTVNVSETKYYGFGGDTVGMRVDGVLSWIFSDQLGSTGITYKADGSGMSRQFYYPFGGIRNPGGAPVVDTDVGFTGQRLDETTGLMFYQARYYDPLTARFISADTIVPSLLNPQDLNRYSYVRNNPVNYTDPSGNCATRNGTIIDDASTDPCSPPGIRWVSMAEGIGYTGDGMPTCRMVPGLYQCTIDSNPGDPSLGYLIFGLIELGFNLSPLGVLTDLAECSDGNKVSCGFAGLEFFSGLGPLKRLLKNFKYADDFFDLGRAADKVADTAGAIPRFDVHPRVLSQLDDVRLGPLQGQLTPDDLQVLINNDSALRVVNVSSGNISVIQEVNGVLLRITTAADEFKIISVGPIRPNQVANRLADGGYVEIPTLTGG